MFFLLIQNILEALNEKGTKKKEIKLKKI